MSHRSDLAPQTLQVSLEPEGVEVQYIDGRSVFYHGVPARREGAVTCPPGRDVHVLVTSPDATEGVMVYVNDRKTHDDILESTGVGRVLLDVGESASPFPGVEVHQRPYRVRVEVDPAVTRGRVFVFAEDDMGEDAYEIVAAETDDHDAVPGETADEGAADQDGAAE